MTGSSTRPIPRYGIEASHNFKDSRIDAVSREVLEDDNPVLLFYYVNTERLKK